MIGRGFVLGGRAFVEWWGGRNSGQDVARARGAVSSGAWLGLKKVQLPLLRRELFGSKSPWGARGQ